MKALRLTVILTLAILLIPHGFLQAVDSKGRFYALGVGKRTCREYIEFREKRIKDFTPEDYERTNHVVEHWVAGYLTGHNYYVSDTYDVKGNKSIEEIKVWIEGFCRKDQDEYFAEAVIALAAELHDSRKKTGTITEPDRVTTGTVSVTSTSIAIGIGVNWGKGTLKYHGKEYKFSMKGLSLLDVGVSRTSLTGEVSRLYNVSDLAGTYYAAQAGIAVAGGGGGVAMQNQHYVILNLTGTKTGVRLAIGPAGVSIKLEE